MASTDQVVCSHCQKPFSNDKAITVYPCCHVICSSCLYNQESARKSNENPIICPVCNAEITSTAFSNGGSMRQTKIDPSPEICTICPHEKPQPCYHCHSCGVIGDNSICPGCARQCHQGHIISFSGETTSPCACGHCCYCHIKNSNPLPSDAPRCPSQACPNANDENPTTGPNFTCLDCQSPDEGETCCFACASHCHAGHRVRENPIGPFVCHCGSGHYHRPCQVTGKAIAECTWHLTGPRFIPARVQGPAWFCRDCFTQEGDCMCADCARVCHAGHNVYQIPPDNITSWFCDCGAGRFTDKCPCKLWQVKPSPNDHCTFISNDKRDSTLGTFYECKTCSSNVPDESQSLGTLVVCPDCAKVCHAGHNLREIHGRYICDCGGAHYFSKCRLPHSPKSEPETPGTE